MNENVSEKQLYSIVDPKEALSRGNLYDYYFWPYKYIANVKAFNERDALMLNIQIYCFAAHELNLYLDVYPDDKQALGLYNQYKDMANKYMKEYEKQYGPILLDGVENYPWSWIDSPWPWEGR